MCFRLRDHGCNGRTTLIDRSNISDQAWTLLHIYPSITYQDCEYGLGILFLRIWYWYWMRLGMYFYNYWQVVYYNGSIGCSGYELQQDSQEFTRHLLFRLQDSHLTVPSILFGFLLDLKLLRYHRHRLYQWWQWFGCARLCFARSMVWRTDL